MSRSTRAFILSVTLATAAVAALALPGPAQAQGPRPTPDRPDAQRQGYCGGVITPTLSANSIRLCDTLTVTVQVAPQCLPGSAHLAVVEPMHAFDLEWMKRVSLSAIDALELIASAGTPAAAGVVLYRTLPRTILPLKTLPEHSSEVRSVIREPGPAGTVGCVQFERSMREAVNMLVDARPQDLTRERAPFEMVLFYGGTKEHWWDPCRQRLLDAARLVHSERITLVAGCIGIPPSDQTWCSEMPELVKSRRYYIRSPEMRVEQIIEQDVGEYMEAGQATSLALEQSIPLGLAYVDGSASEAPASIERGSTSTVLRWAWTELDASQAHTITYRVAATNEGSWSIAGAMEVHDGQRLARHLPMLEQAIGVEGRCEPPTETPSPTPTLTPVPSATSTRRPTPSQTPSPMPTHTPEPTETATARPVLYLPVLLREECRSLQQRADVVLAIDTSSSMSGQKLADAQAAALHFVAVMDLAAGRDQVAIVRFDETAELSQALTQERAHVEAAIRALGPRPGTRIDRGLARAFEELRSERRMAANQPVIVLLTDGKQTGDPEPVRRIAAEIRAAGVLIYTIGLGAEADEALMVEVAGAAARYHHAPDSAELRAIYADVARDILCPSEQHWPRNPTSDRRRSRWSRLVDEARTFDFSSMFRSQR